MLCGRPGKVFMRRSCDPLLHTINHRPLLCAVFALGLLKPRHFIVRWLRCDTLAAFAVSPHCTFKIPMLSALLLASPLPLPPILYCDFFLSCMRFAEAMHLCPTVRRLKTSLFGLQEHVKERRVLWDQPHWQQDQRGVQEHNHGGSDAAILWAGGGRR